MKNVWSLCVIAASGVVGAAQAQTPLVSLGSDGQGSALGLMDAAAGGTTVAVTAGGGAALLSGGSLTPLTGFSLAGTRVSGDGRVAVQSVFSQNRWQPRVWRNGQATDLARPQLGARVLSANADGTVLAGFATVPLPIPGFSAFVATRWTRTNNGWTYAANDRLSVTQLVSANGIVVASGPGPAEVDAQENYAALWYPDGTVEILPNIAESAGFVTPLAATADAGVIVGTAEVLVVPPGGGEFFSRLVPVVWERVNGAWNVAMLPGQAEGELPPAALSIHVTTGGAIIASEAWVWERGASGYGAPRPLTEYLTRRRCDVQGWSGLQLVDVSADGTAWFGTGLNLRAPSGPREEGWVVRPPSAPCDDIDFDNDTVFPSDQDVAAFFAVLAGAECPSGLPLTCDSLDFNGNLVTPEDQDVIDFFRVLAGDTCD
ncbi:MAG TPA: hypothetical protein VK157_07695 [Phycisphaerales bacterium]|nr:hypothetical protein [Phycisphaerales bacterium]